MKNRFKNNSFTRGPRNLVFIAIFMLLSLALLTKLADYTRTVKIMPYSTFLKTVEGGQVQAVHIAGQEVRGILKNGQRFETFVADTPKNLELLREHNVEFSISQPAAQLGFWHMMFLFMILSIPMALYYFLRQSKGGGGGGGSGNIFTMGKSKAKMHSPSNNDINFDAVAGAQDAKQELQDIVDYLKNPEKYRKLGAKIPRGILLVGEPGNGKTLLAKAVAGEANVPFFSITGSDFIEVFVGVGAARVRDMFARARKNSPSIIFIDEIDAIGRQRGTGFGGGHDEREQTLNQLLTEMDGFDTAGAPVIILAATNMPEVLDKALLRPGRFDRRVTVPFPDEKSREEILKIHARSIKLAEDADLALMAKDTAGFSGADLANLINKAALNASKSNSHAVTMQDLRDAHKALINSQDSTSGVSGSTTKVSGQAKMFMPSQVKTTFKDVAGLDEVKEELQDFIDYLKNPEHYKRLGARITRGVLLVGDPGNGKTLLARAVAGEANVPFFNISGSEFVEKFVGVGASRVRELFIQARKHSPSIIFIDEIDAVGGKRNGDGDGGHEERYQTLNQLLTEMDGFDNEHSVIVMAATNRPDTLDKALLRAGRFDRQVNVPYPDLKARKQILELHTKKIKLDDGVDLNKIARGTPGFAAADLANLVNEATLHATKNPEREMVTVDDFEEARDKITLGKESKSKILTEEDKKLTAYHESGHALVRLLMPDVLDPLHKLTIIPRGQALGVTHSLPEREKYTARREEMIATIMSALGGRVAEELVFNIIGTGASNDFEKATELAHKMVRYYGMSDKLGPVIYNDRGQFKYSQKTAELIDQEVKSILEQAYEKTKELLSQNRDMLDKLSLTLLEKETLFASEVYELLGLTPREEFKFS